MTDPVEATHHDIEPASVPPPSAPPSPSRRRRLLRRAIDGAILVVAGWMLLAYVILPALWRHYEHHPELENAPKTTLTAQGIPGDPLNLGLIATRDELVAAMLDAGWAPADPITLKSSLGIARSVLLKRPYRDAPVSNLFVFGRRQDLAFEKPVGKSASQRHHVRFWRSADLGAGSIPLWIGAVTFDRSVGISHRTGQVTHHIAPDVDRERDALVADLAGTGVLARVYQVTGVGSTLVGRNGGGDRYYTDGELSVGVIGPANLPGKRPERLANPAVVQIKDQFWSVVRPLLQSIDDSGVLNR